jgi:gamma-glutamyltranspeptidase/glutathione hydrolase
MPKFSGAAVTVPGAVRAWDDLRARHGSRPLAELLAPAIETAERGFPVTEWIARAWALSAPKLRRDPDWRSGEDHGPPQPSGHELLRDGRAPHAGEVIALPTLARTLRGISEAGPDFLYKGEFAKAAARHVQAYGGWLTEADFAAHTGTWDAPIFTDYRGVRVYECPPNGQGLAALLALASARGLDLAAATEAERAHLLIECMRLAFADAREHVHDPASASIPLARLLSEDYAAARRARVNPLQAALDVPPGMPAGPDTIYLSVVDGAGNACSLIQSCYMGVGTGLVVPGAGVSLQNRGHGFSLEPGHPNELVPGLRPYHTIIPGMATRDGQLYASFGIMGGYMQPQAHLQVLSNLLDRRMNPQHALDWPRWMLEGSEDALGANQPGGLLYVEEDMDVAVQAELARRGHRLKVLRGFDRIHAGGGQVILREGHVLVAGSDPRKDGCAAGW